MGRGLSPLGVVSVNFIFLHPQLRGEKGGFLLGKVSHRLLTELSYGLTDGSWLEKIASEFTGFVWHGANLRDRPSRLVTMDPSSDVDSLDDVTDGHQPNEKDHGTPQSWRRQIT